MLKNAIHDKRVAEWNRQTEQFGGVSQAALDRIKELAEEHNPILEFGRKCISRKKEKLLGSRSKDRRLPAAGATITKYYKGIPYQVKVLDKGFEYDGTVYRTLTAVVKAITGDHWNGYLFFGLRRKT